MLMIFMISSFTLEIKQDYVNSCFGASIGLSFPFQETLEANTKVNFNKCGSEGGMDGGRK